MTRDTAERARGLLRALGLLTDDGGPPFYPEDFQACLEALAQFQSEAREHLAAWMIEHSFSTGHGDTFEDLLKELDWQVKELRGARLEEAKWWRPRTDLRHDDECSVNNSFSDPFCDCDATKRLKEAEARIAALAQALQPEEKEGE